MEFIIFQHPHILTFLFPWALELEEMKNEMLSVANSTDSSGAFIFSD